MDEHVSSWGPVKWASKVQKRRSSRRGNLKVTSTHPVSHTKQRGKWGHNQQVLPFTYMKAQRESGQRFKSASSNPRRGRAFFHVNEPIDQKPDASIWTTMYTQWAPRGESYTMIVLRVRGAQMPCVPSTAASKPVALLSHLPSVCTSTHRECCIYSC